MTTVAVTGASGKLGRHVVRDLHEYGYRATVGVPDRGLRPLTSGLRSWGMITDVPLRLQ